LLTVPATEPGANVLRGMAAERLVALDALSDAEVRQYLDSSPLR